MSRDYARGLVLSGGGARGVAHFGVLEVLENEGLLPDLIVGTSIGALVAALYGLTGSASRALDEMRDTLDHPSYIALQRKGERLASRAPKHNGPAIFAPLESARKMLMVVPHFARESLMELSLMDDLISTMIGNATFDDLVIPIGIVSLDVRSGKSIVFTRGSLRTAVLSSVALPGIFPLISVRNWLLTDGGPTAKVPVRIARMMGARTILAVDVSYESPPRDAYDTAFSALARVSDVISLRIRYEDLEQADVVIRPDLGEIAWFEFDAWEFLLREGQEAAQQQLEEIRQLYRPSLLERLRRKFRPRRVCPAVHTEFAEAPPL